MLPRGVLEPGAVLQELLELWQSLGAWCCPERSSQGRSGHLRWSCCSLEPAQPLGSRERPPRLRQQPPALAQGHAAAPGMVSLLRAKAPGLAWPPASSSSRCCCAPCTTLMSPPIPYHFPERCQASLGTSANREGRKQPGLHLLHWKLIPPSYLKVSVNEAKLLSDKRKMILAFQGY